MLDSRTLKHPMCLTELFSKGHYIVPIYQRNYAWTEEQIGPLIQDVWDYARVAEDKQKDYYIGSLVVFVRPRENQRFEVIDGQQRHTTLSVLLSVLKNKFQQQLPAGLHVNLEYDSRDRAKQTLQDQFAGREPIDSEPSLKDAYQVCVKKLESKDDPIDLPRFTQYLLKRVKIVQVEVPHDTDLNHYFEIMNNRGEQLEKHEVLKARLMNTLDKTDPGSLDVFATIWDACSDMTRYVQYGFPKAARGGVFGKDLNELPNSFDGIREHLGVSESKDAEMTMLECLGAGSKVEVTSPDDGRDGSSERFGSIINFPNFLLHALRIQQMDRIRREQEFDIALDDKSLLATFEAQSNLDAKVFVVLLLRLRLLFDRYLIKREWDKDWSLKRLQWYERDSINYVNTFADGDHHPQIVHLLSMLHVSFPSQIYKHWLSGVLLHLHENASEITGASYLDFLERYDSRLFFGRFSTSTLEYRELIAYAPDIDARLDVSALHTGTDVQNYVFNRLDYLVWKVNLVAGESTPKALQLQRSFLDKFTFTFRSSVEHYFPQHPLAGGSLKGTQALPQGVDSFGNLCLISHSANSKLSNLLPAGKKDHYCSAGAVESLKQHLMMKYEFWGPEPEGLACILDHQQAVVKLLECRTEEVGAAMLGSFALPPA